VLKAIEAAAPKAVIASNTSTLPISSLAGYTGDDANFIGVHFFSPVDKMMLVEIIMGAKTGDKALAIAIDFVKKIKKTPIVVNDCRGFFANRCVGNYIREGHLMLMEGVPPAMIENCAKMAGMPVGPLSLNDEVAVDLAWKVLNATKADLGANAIDPAQEKLLESMVVKHERLGRKNGKGFYDYNGKEKQLWHGLADLTSKKLDPDLLSITELKQRFLVVQALEAARTVEEGVITDVREADVGSILGFGFAPYTGGAISYIDTMGVKTFVALADDLAKKHGSRFEAPKILRDMVIKGDNFYKRFPVKAA
jgi:3-hydroxyacyl-CoA dehydrogenase/enoyl-CoA hydratase/3-hydroxybutyryl-CoA epimerase